MKTVLTLTWYRHFERNGGLNQILRRQTSRSHYGSKVPAVTITVFKYRNKIVGHCLDSLYSIFHMELMKGVIYVR